MVPSGEKSGSLEPEAWVSCFIPVPSGLTVMISGASEVLPSGETSKTREPSKAILPLVPGKAAYAGSLQAPTNTQVASMPAKSSVQRQAGTSMSPPPEVGTSGMVFLMR